MQLSGFLNNSETELSLKSNHPIYPLTYKQKHFLGKCYTSDLNILPVFSYSNPMPFNKNIKWAVYVILNFMAALLKRGKTQVK